MKIQSLNNMLKLAYQRAGLRPIFLKYRIHFNKCFCNLNIIFNSDIFTIKHDYFININKPAYITTALEKKDEVAKHRNINVA